MSSFRSSNFYEDNLSAEPNDNTTKYFKTTGHQQTSYEEEGPSIQNIYSLQPNSMYSLQKPSGLDTSSHLGSISASPAPSPNPNCNNDPSGTSIGWYIGGGAATVLLIIGIIFAIIKREDVPTFVYLLLSIGLALSLGIIGFGVLLQYFLQYGTVFNYCVPTNKACTQIYTVAFSGYYVILILLLALFIGLIVLSLYRDWSAILVFLFGFLATAVGAFIFFLSVMQTYIASGKIFGYQSCNTCTPSS